MNRVTLPAFGFSLLIALLPHAALAQNAPPDATLTGHASSVLDVAFSPDGKHLASAADDGLLKIWDLAGKKELFSLSGLRNNANKVRYTPDGKTIVTLGSDNNVMLVDADAGKLRQSVALPDLTGGATALDLSPDGKTVAVVGRSTLRFINVSSGAAQPDIAVHKSYGVTAVAYSADGKFIATAGTDNQATLVDIDSGNLRTFKLSLNGVAVAFSRDGKTLFVSSSDQVLHSFNIAGGEATSLVNKLRPIFTLCISPDGKTLILAGPGHGPWLLTIADSTLRDEAFGSDNQVKSAAISPDGKWLAGGANSGEVYLWKMGS